MKKILVLCMSMLLWSAVAFAGVSINTASEQDLESLPNIGSVKAESIVQYRAENGAFQSKDDLMNVKGIGPKTLEKLKDQIDL
jgi:competence protein ComEA